MSKLENIPDDSPTKKLPRITEDSHICKYNPREEVTIQYYKTYCSNCVEGIIKSRVRKKVACPKYRND